MRFDLVTKFIDMVYGSTSQVVVPLTDHQADVILRAYGLDEVWYWQHVSHGWEPGDAVCSYLDNQERAGVNVISLLRVTKEKVDGNI